VSGFRPGWAATISALLLAAPAAAGLLEPSADTVVGPQPRPPRTRFVAPLHALVSSPFGRRWGRFHAGIDIEGWQRTDVHSAAAGMVTRVGWLPAYAGYGLVVVVRHSPTLVTMYAHLARSFVRAGERVRAGQHIATAGCTGSCSGTHLHFEVHLGRRPVDPMRWLHGKLSFR
jgi:murein DD-endopeptidase MepM/ murein hydrolase activator NlpD